MKNEMFVVELFKAVIQQDKEKLRTFFDEDAIIRWHNTDEEFTIEEYVQANCEYPGTWEGKIEQVEWLDNKIIYAAKVWSPEPKMVSHVTSFLTMKGDKILRMDEYFGDDGEPPQWRKEMNLGKKISATTQR